MSLLRRNCDFRDSTRSLSKASRSFIGSNRKITIANTTRSSLIKLRSYSYFKQRRHISSSSQCINNTHDDDVLPVLIVGAGPVGLVLSILLTKLGIKCSIVEKNNGFSKHPQAHFINNRSMEVFRKLDGLAEEIQKFQPPVDLWRKFIYCTSLTGSILGSVDHMQSQDFERIVSPVSVAHFSQYKLTRLLYKQLKNLKFNELSPEERGVFNGNCKERAIMMGHECVSLEASDRFVNATVSFLKEGQYMERNIRCSYLVGTDGAGSTVRNLVGFGMKGERDLQKLVSVHFMSRDLGRYLSDERPGMLFFIFNLEVIGVLVAHDLNQGEFVLQIPFYPPQQILEDFSHEVSKNLIFKLVGRELADIDVVDIKPWVMHAEVAEKFVSSDNRIILAGDAAHRFPPAGGFGMNTGIQDAHNLAWKLALVVDGVAPSSLIRTYETERRPIALFNTALSVKNFRAAMEVPAALGLDPSIANTVHQVINKGFGSVLPSGLQKAMLEGIFTVGRAQLSDLLLNENNPLGSSRLAKLKSIFEEGKSLQLQFPAEDLGFRYAEGAVVPDSASMPDSHEAPSGRRRDYVPCAEYGSRLPHMNVRMLSSKDIFSTHDLVSGKEVEFLLIISPLKESYDLARAASNVAERLKVSAKICVMWPADTVTGVEDRSKVALAPWSKYIDVVEIKSKSDSLSWWGICQATDKGAMLVRPDEHIAWQVKNGVAGDPELVMEGVFAATIGIK